MARTATGKYTLRFLRLPRVLAAKGANGAEAETWPDPPAADQRFYAAPEAMTAGETLAAGVRRPTGALKVRVPGRALAIDAADRVKNVATGEVFAVTGVERDAAETVLSVERVAGQDVGQ